MMKVGSEWKKLEVIKKITEEEMGDKLGIYVAEKMNKRSE